MLLVDGMNIYHRCYAVSKKSDDNVTPEGGFIRMLLYGIEKFGKDVIVVWDGKKGVERRKRVYSGYKEGRKEELGEDFFQGMYSVRDILYDGFGISQMYSEMDEADDVIAWLVSMLSDDVGEKICIMSNDMDFVQLVIGRDNVVLFNGRKVISRKDVDFDTVEDYLRYKSLVGDASDNIKGVPGVGARKARRIIEQKLYDEVAKLYPDVRMYFDLMRLGELSGTPVLIEGKKSPMKVAEFVKRNGCFLWDVLEKLNWF